MSVRIQGCCPRCSGRLVEQGDHYGRYQSCLTCGYVNECWQAPALVLVDPHSGRERRREPSHQQRRL